MVNLQHQIFQRPARQTTLLHSHSLLESSNSLDLNPKHVSISSRLFGHHLLTKPCSIFHSQVESSPPGPPSPLACITPACLSRVTQESRFPACLPHPVSFHVLGALSTHLIHCSAECKFLHHLTTVDVT